MHVSVHVYVRMCVTKDLQASPVWTDSRDGLADGLQSAEGQTEVKEQNGNRIGTSGFQYQLYWQVDVMDQYLLMNETITELLQIKEM